MKKYEETQVRISNHAIKQYRERVELTSLEQLTELCAGQLHRSEYDYDSKGFIHLGGVWWVYDIEGSHMVLITCYGRSHYHMPKALKWAIRHNDRIDLQAIR